jgi:hypothetical protein
MSYAPSGGNRNKEIDRLVSVMKCVSCKTGTEYLTTAKKIVLERVKA